MVFIADEIDIIMKIMLTSYAFAPSIGGIETTSLCFAEEFARMGHDVCVVTKTGAGDGPNPTRPFRIVRRPSAQHLAALVRWSDIVFQNNISIELAWPLAFVPRPWYIALQGRNLSGPNETMAKFDYIKLFLMRFANVVSISKYIADNIPYPSTIIGNPYDDSVYFPDSTVPKAVDLVFVGRLVTNKGVDLLINALHMLKKRGLAPNLTIVGAGTEQEALSRQASQLGLAAQIDFLGPKHGAALADEIRKHEIMVVPSRWKEPFGVVALEGAACGCVVLGSEGGGLVDAIGPSGTTFENGNVVQLAEKIALLVTSPDLREQYRRNAASHVAQFTSRAVASKYIELFQSNSRLRS